jgi:ABC-type sulfate transport system permease subunit
MKKVETPPDFAVASVWRTAYFYCSDIIALFNFQGAEELETFFGLPQPVSPLILGLTLL